LPNRYLHTASNTRDRGTMTESQKRICESEGYRSRSRTRFARDASVPTLSR
jgi:hypothetical protein